MSGLPEELPAPGESVGPVNVHGTDFTFRGIDDDHWIVDGPVGITTEISRIEDGTLTMVRSDGKTQQTGEGDNWDELAAQFF